MSQIASRRLPGAPGEPLGPPGGARSRAMYEFAPPRGGSRDPRGRPWGALGAKMAPRSRQNGREEAGKRLLGDGWRQRWCPGAFFPCFGEGLGYVVLCFWSSFSLASAIVVRLIFVTFLGFHVVLNLCVLGAARKRAHMLKLLALPIDFHVFHILFLVHRHRAEAKNKENDNSKND